jgi:DNA invertase Pin-like site-specific DNA recombinase
MSYLILIKVGRRGVISVEDWAEIRRLHRAKQMPIRATARHLGISKNTVKRAQPPRRRARDSARWLRRRNSAPA